MGKYFSKEIKKIYNESQLLFTYLGEKYKLVFYSNHKQDNKLEIDASLVEDTYFILIDEGYFKATLKDNKNALKELEQVLSYNRGIASYFYYGLGYLFFLWIFYAFPTLMTGYLLSKLPFYLQIAGSIIIYGIIYLLPLWLMFKVRKNKINTVPSSRFMLYYLKDEEYRKAMALFDETNKVKPKWWKRQIIIRKISPFHNLRKKVILLYSLFIIFWIGILLSFYATFNVPLNYLPTLYHEMMLTDYGNTDIIKTKYQFSEKTTSLSLPLALEPCGGYFCSRFEDTIYDNNFNTIDLNQYLEDDESFSQILTINEGIVVFNYCIEDIDDRLYKVVDLETNTIISELDATALGINGDFYIFVDAAVNDQEIYLSGSIHEGDEKSGYLVRIDNNGNITNYKSTEGTIISTVTVYNDFLYITEVSAENNEDMVLKLVNSNLEVIDEKIIPNFRTIHVFVNDNKMFLSTLEDGMTNYYQLLPSLELEKEYSFISNTNYLYATNNVFYSGVSLKSYQEFNNDFELINKGLECFECNNDEYFSYYYFIKNDNQLYALTDDHILVFTETSDYRYSLSRSPLTAEGFILYIAAYIIPLTIWFNALSRRNKDILITKEYLKQLPNENKT